MSQSNIVLGEAHFYGRKFLVNPTVLIPRPETEELVHLIIEENQGNDLRILDVGTGSGCIAISLSREMNNPDMYAIDINKDALGVATQNSRTHEASVKFRQCDILKEDLPGADYDILVSNPPYIPMKQKALLARNVIEFEPHEALFVKDSDPLLFYRRISEQAVSHLKPGGRLYFEINENFGSEIVALLQEVGLDNVSLVSDLHGSDRIVKASLNSEVRTSA